MGLVLALAFNTLISGSSLPVWCLLGSAPCSSVAEKPLALSSAFPGPVFLSEPCLMAMLLGQAHIYVSGPGPQCLFLFSLRIAGTVHYPTAKHAVGPWEAHADEYELR